MRGIWAIIFVILIIALLVCAGFAKRSHKAIGRSVAMLVSGLIPPMLGNLIIIVSRDPALTTVGCYLYYLGMNYIMLALLRFTGEYCGIVQKITKWRYVVYMLILADVIQLFLNLTFGHAFALEELMVGGLPYYRAVPLLGLTLHRILDYGIFFAVLIIFFAKMIRSLRVYFERYAVIFFSMVFAGIWESYYIFARTPIDRSMTGFAAFGFLVFFFALYYRPMRLLDRMLIGMTSELAESLFFYDDGGNCIWANNNGLTLTGTEPGDYESIPAKLKSLFGEELSSEAEWQKQITLGEAENIKYYVLEKNAVEGSGGRPLGGFISVRDITENQLELQREKYNADHDSLTGLFSRERLYREIENALKEHPGEEYCIILIDINDFKLVNDLYGNAFGDFALQSIAKKIEDSMPEGSVYGRLGGDNFGVCLPSAVFDSSCLEGKLSQFIVKQGSVEHQMLAHYGVYRVNDPNMDISVMFDRARLALATIKGDYQHYVAGYDDSLRDKILWNQQIAAQLSDALATGQIRPFLQPIVDFTGKVVGAEALVRWFHPVEGCLSPAAFIPVFEQNGMIADVDRHMWRYACKILHGWEEEHSDLFVSVNISPKDFDFMDVADEIISIVEEYEIDPARLRLEITETVMMADIENRIMVLNRLKEAGFMIEMDDFGSGYSSLSMLKDMPVDVLKIDMTFLDEVNVAQDKRTKTIIHNVIDMSEELGITSLIEGVETQEQYKLLGDMGCKLFQGYYFSRPIPVDDFRKLRGTTLKPA